MAYTTARTWTDGELINAAIMNPHIRDNFNAMGPHLIVRKTSDQSVTSSTTLVNDTALLLPLAANDVWQFEFLVSYTGASTGDIKMAFTFPTAGDLRLSGPAMYDSGGSLIHEVWSTTTSPTSSKNFACTSTTSIYTLPFKGVFVNGANAGNLQLQFAQNSSDVTSTTIKANSTLWAVKLRVILIHPRMVTMNELLTYDETMAEVKTFLGAERGRFRLEGQGWSRWWRPVKVLPRIRTQMVGMKVGHPWQEIQRQDKEQVSVEKVSDVAP